MSETLNVAHNVVLSDDVAAKIEALLGQGGRDDLRLRVVIQPDECSRLTCQLHLDERELGGDVIHDFGGIEVIVDKMSKPYLDGAAVGLANSIDRQGSTIDNPNAVGSYACGDSFH